MISFLWYSNQTSLNAPGGISSTKVEKKWKEFFWLVCLISSDWLDMQIYTSAKKSDTQTFIFIRGSLLWIYNKLSNLSHYFLSDCVLLEVHFPLLSCTMRGNWRHSPSNFCIETIHLEDYSLWVLFLELRKDTWGKKVQYSHRIFMHLLQCFGIICKLRPPNVENYWLAYFATMIFGKFSARANHTSTDIASAFLLQAKLLNISATKALWNPNQDFRALVFHVTFLPDLTITLRTYFFSF